jgi:hypothetical protein
MDRNILETLRVLCRLIISSSFFSVTAGSSSCLLVINPDFRACVCTTNYCNYLMDGRRLEKPACCRIEYEAMDGIEDG